MKKFKILLCLVLCSFLIITGCTNKENNNEEENKTVASQLVTEFKKEIAKSKDIKEVADKISESNIIVPTTVVTEITEDDYLAGFNEEIKEFKKAVSIAPMIGTIPFVAYIFEVDNPKEFANNLKEQANLRWNICTEADEMQTSIVDNYVFFVMSPSNFE